MRRSTTGWGALVSMIAAAAMLITVLVFAPLASAQQPLGDDPTTDGEENGSSGEVEGTASSEPDQDGSGTSGGHDLDGEGHDGKKDRDHKDRDHKDDDGKKDRDHKDRKPKPEKPKVKKVVKVEKVVEVEVEKPRKVVPAAPVAPTPPAPPGAPAQPRVAQPVAVSELPFTGSNTPALAGLGGLLLVSGAALFAVSRRRGRLA